MVTATPFKLAVGDEQTQLTKPINFKPPMAKNTGKAKDTVTHDIGPANMLLVGGIIGIFILFIFTTKEKLFSFRNKKLAKRKNAKKWSKKLRQNNWRNLNVLSLNNDI